MDSFDGFMEPFRKWEKEKDDDNLSKILVKGPAYFQNLSTSDIDLVLSILLDDKTGLLRFLANASDRSMKRSITKGFKLLNFIIEQFFGSLNQYTIGIKRVCQSAITGNCTQNVKTAAVECFESLTKVCTSEDLKFDEIVRAFVTELPSSTQEERAKFFEVLGSVAKYHPQAIPLSDLNIIFERLMSDFDYVLSRRREDLQKKELKNYLKALNDLLTNFSPNQSSETFEYFKKCYQCIKALCAIDLSQKFKFVSRAAIALLGGNMALFINHIYDDALFWHSTLLKWVNLPDIEDRKPAFNTSCVYYKMMATVLSSENTRRSQKIFEDLMQCFESEFTNNKASPITLKLSIRGYGHMADPCKYYTSEKDVGRMFSLIARRTALILMYPNNSNDVKNSLENIAYSQLALSQILLKISDVSISQLTQLSTLSLILIKRFPDLPVTSHTTAVNSLMETIHNVKKACSRRSFEEFIRQLVYEGVIWSCSHTLYVDAEREREIKSLENLPVCYKNYLPLWQLLIHPNDKIIKLGSSTISVQIFLNMIESCVKLVKKLNLDVTTNDTSCQFEAFDIPVAVNDTDFRVFINLVDLFVAVLEELKPNFIESKVDWLLSEMIKKANQHSLISGFYKLLRVVLKLYNSFCYRSEHKLSSDTMKILCHYFVDTIDTSSSFSGELQASCLAMIFEMPVSIAENMLGDLVCTFKTAFSLGQSNFTLAQSALNALEKWTKKMNDEETKKFLIAVVPSLEPFLQSIETVVEVAVPIERKVIKNIVLMDHEKTLQEFQRRILLFFGSLNSEVTRNISNERSAGNEVMSDDQNLLEYTLLYKDIRPIIYLDKILPRTIELALSSTDRRTRVVACEVLHSIVTLMLGRKTDILSSNPDQLLPLFKRICPAVLRLGSDSDQVIQQLFNPLMIQLTHWYSSSKMLDSSETDCLIEILFDSLTYESNMALCDFSGVCLAEFVKWSIHQSSDTELKNTVAIMNKIINFALHPSVQKRVGAAIAFNYLDAMLRENGIIIDIFWLELLFCFIKSLDGCNSAQIFKSLKNVQTVIDSKHELLNEESSRRRKPEEFGGTSLKDAVDWLLVQCGSLDENCRSKSMEALTRISKHVPAFGSVRKAFANYLNLNGIRSLNEIILKDLWPKMETLCVPTMKPLLRTLDCYIWILDENIMSLDSLFTDNNEKKDLIFDCIITFVRSINVKRGEVDKAEFANQYQEHSILKCKIILKILEFTKILFDKMENQAGQNSPSYVPTAFWNIELYSLISKCIFGPEVFGFCLKNLEIIEALPAMALGLLDTLIQRLDNEQLSLLRSTISKGVESKWKEFLDLDTILKYDTSIALKSYLKGITMFERFHQFDQLFGIPVSDHFDSANKVTEIFNSLKIEEDGEVVSRDLDSSKKEYLENLMEFLCLKFEANMVNTLVNIVESKTELTKKDSTTIFHGEYFMDLFRIPVFRNLLKHAKQSMDTLLSDSLKDKFDTIHLILEDLLMYVKKHRKISEEFLSELETEFVHRFSTFRSLTSDLKKGKEKLINLYSLLVKISKNPSKICNESSELYSWIIQELLDPSDLEYKTRILNSFFPCIVDETVHKKEKLINCLHKLKTDYNLINMNDIVKGSPDHLNMIVYFQTLLRHLRTLKSVTIFDCTTHLTIENIPYLWDDASTKYLIGYFKEISTEDSQKSLKILYEYFMTTENLESRLAVLDKLLLTCIHFCNANAIEQFFEQIFKTIREITSQNLPKTGSGLQSLIVSKIGCYKLLEVMFAKVPLERIKNGYSRIAKSAVETTETGRELFQSLIINILSVRKLKSHDTESKELMRLLHCAAYNCSISIVSLKSQEQFYVLPFAENRLEDQLVWENIIDTNRRYELGQDFEEIPQECRKLINIRKQQSNLKPAPSSSCIKSYNLDGSTLNEDLSSFGLYESRLESNSLAEDITNEEMMYLTFECDDINSHECMAPICGIITHMISKNIFNLQNEEEYLTMPEWMRCFHSFLKITTAYNVLLFLNKVILNVQEAFKPYAKFFLSPALIFLNLHFGKYQLSMNYVVKDILVMLIDWQGIAIPSQTEEKRLAQMLIESLIKNGDSRRRYVQKYNVEIIDNLVNAWQSCLEIPEGILNFPNASRKFRVRMILIFLLNDKRDTLELKDETLLYLIDSLNDPDEEILLDVFNAFGLVLNFLESKYEHERKQRIIKIIQTSIGTNKDDNKCIKYIYEIHKFYPRIVSDCFKQVTSKFFGVENVNKNKCLELFLSFVPNLAENQILSELKYIKFEDILTSKISTCQNVALRIIQKLINILKPSDYLPLALLIIPYSKNSSMVEREIVMNIFMAVHRQYKDNVEDDIAVTKLKNLSKRILLSGLLDANEYLQKELSKFWKEEGSVTDKSIERMLEIFDLYDTDLESTYLSILPLMMLHLVSKDPEFEEKMFTSPIECQFIDYPIEILQCHSKNVGFSPMFTSSFARQVSQYYSHSNSTLACFNRSLNQSLSLRDLDPSRFEEILFRAEDTEENKSTYPALNCQEIPQPARNKKSTRLLSNTEELRNNIIHEQIDINIRRDEMLKNKVDRQRNSIRIYRKYRIGNFPDTEIPHSSLIQPLQELVKNDEVIARDLTVAIFCSMLKKMASDQRNEFLKKLSSSLKVILDKTQGSKSLIATVLEMILNSRALHVSSNLISNVSKSFGLLSLGALLLEEKMISGYTTGTSEPLAKRSKYETHINGEESDDWLQLANIYKSMNDFDIVQIIFGSQKFGEELQEASFAQAASNWRTARGAYEKAYEKAEGLAKDYCQESMFVCLAHLSDWKRINDRIETELEGEFDALWQKPMNENFMTPWLLQGQIHGMINNADNDRFRKALDVWVNTKEKLTQLKAFHGEELALFHIDETPEFAENCLMSGLEKTIQEWKLNPLYSEQKINKYLKLRELSDINTYLKGIKEKNQLIPNVQSMLTFWNNSVPSSQDNLLLWDKHIAYRLYLFDLLKRKFNVEASGETNDITDDLNTSVIKQCLNIIHAAFDQCNLHFMNKYLRYSEPYLKKDHLNLNDEWQLAFAKYKYLCYADSETQKEKCETYIASWEVSHNLIINGRSNSKLQMDVRQHIGRLVIELQELVMKSDSISTMLSENQSIAKYLSPINDEASILRPLNDYCLARFKECYESGNSGNIGKYYLKVSMYCHSMNDKSKTGLDLSEEFIHSTLSAMRYGSLEATQYFPCLLHLDYSNNPELIQIFERESANVETWMFLKWQAQLLSHIGTPIKCSVIAPILLRLAETYPNSFVYSFRMTKEMNKSLSTNFIVTQLTQILSENKDLELFLEAMNHVVQPELYFEYHFNALETNTPVAITARKILLNIINLTTEDDEKILVHGRVYNFIKSKIKELLHYERNELIVDRAKIINELKKLLKNRIRGSCKLPLEEYSPWLHKFSGGNIEVPGQYSGDRKPMPQYHARIVKLNPTVMILPSLRKPIRITMLGNDGTNYKFLVKFGEDLRTDERIEQLFVLMNRILQGDAVCREPKFSIDTYLVIPLTCSLGLIQWVDNTKSLNEIIDSVLKREDIKDSYLDWMDNPSSKDSIDVVYKKAVLRYGRQEVTTKFHHFKSKLDWDLLRKAFKILSSSPESFFAVRKNFVTSYATMCIAQWILGIGDRNLGNTLISYSSGKAVGIDFGYSFDAAIDLCSVPELTPFRLTPQILGLLRPFDEHGLLKITMMNVLRALKRGKDPLIACMDIFIKEPLVDWLAKKRTQQYRRESSATVLADVEWYPKKKISIVADKLNGAKPSMLTLKQIRDQYHNTPYLDEYIDIINGTDNGQALRVRSHRKDENLSTEEQVECLLDQATDPNILARAWIGWEPWI